MSSHPNTDPFAQNPYTQNPYKAVGGQTFVGGPSNAILGMQKPFSYPNNNPRSVPGSSPGGNMGLPSGAFFQQAPSWSSQYLDSGGLAGQATRSAQADRGIGGGVPGFAYGGTVMHRAIVGDPQADGGPNPELVEAYGPIRVTPLRNLPRRQAHASWARLPHYDQGGTTDGDSDDAFDYGSDNDSYSGDEGNGGNDADDGTSDAVPPAPDSFDNQPAPNDRPLGQSLGSNPESAWAQAAAGEGNSRPVGLPPDGDWQAYHPGDRPPGVGLDEGSGIVGASIDALSGSPPPAKADSPSKVTAGQNKPRAPMHFDDEVPPSTADTDTYNSIYNDSNTARALVEYARSRGVDFHILSQGGTSRLLGGQKALAYEKAPGRLLPGYITVDTLGENHQVDWAHDTAPFHEIVHLLQHDYNDPSLRNNIPPELRAMLESVQYHFDLKNPGQPYDSNTPNEFEARRIQNHIIQEVSQTRQSRWTPILKEYGGEFMRPDSYYGRGYTLPDKPKLQPPFPVKTVPAPSPTNPSPTGHP